MIGVVIVDRHTHEGGGLLSTQYNLEPPTAHRHSELVRQLDELIAYAKMLGGDEVDRIAYTPEFLRILSRFERICSEHIAHEEAECFLVIAQMGPIWEGQIEMLKCEHRTINTLLNIIHSSIVASYRESAAQEYPTPTISALVKILYQVFKRHSQNERDVLLLAEQINSQML